MGRVGTETVCDPRLPRAHLRTLRDGDHPTRELWPFVSLSLPLSPTFINPTYV